MLAEHLRERCADAKERRGADDHDACQYCYDVGTGRILLGPCCCAQACQRSNET
jgi:hypothetical protein